jgi:ubiquinone biosynthesis protein
VEPAGGTGSTGFTLAPEHRPQGLVRRFFVTWRHLVGLYLGGVVALAGVSAEPTDAAGRRLTLWLARLAAPFARRMIRGDLRALPFPVQFRRRLELLGPTYIKLGQVLSLREDILPLSLTRELHNLLDRLPVVPFERIRQIVEKDLGDSLERLFAAVDRDPIGSASIAQTHRATTREGDLVILKVVKPGIREMLERDAVLLSWFGRLLQLVVSRYQPRRIIGEFVEYTLREVDLRREADNAETFSANFADQPDIVFPRIYRRLSGRNVLCMELLDGYKPSDPRTATLPDVERDRLVELGAIAIIRMLYRDGFFHADLHPGNLMVLPGPKCGFIDLGMVGRFDEDLRRTLLYYFYCLVIGDVENASRYLLAVADAGPRADPQGFRREVEDISRRWSRAASFRDFSLARLILESVGKAAQYGLYFPVELVLMVKAIVTFEGVGQLLRPGFDVAGVSQAHVRAIFLEQFNPMRFAREGLRGAPELVDALVRAPLIVSDGVRMLERNLRQPPASPLAALRWALMSGACLVAGVIAVATSAPPVLWIVLFALALVFFFKTG